MRRGNKRKVVAIVGPTAVGKSSLSVLLAKKYNGEVVSADSRQVYRGLDVGTGKITEKETRGIPHHLLNVASPKNQFSVAKYQRLARKKLDALFSLKKLPIIVGGTGLYIQAIVNDVSFPEVPPNRSLRERLRKKTTAQLFSMLKKLDADRARSIDASNPRRLVRAIEIVFALGKVPPYLNTPRKDIELLLIGLTLPSEALKKRIGLRLRERIKKGMLREVKNLHAESMSWKRMEELGLEYRYLSRYLRGLISREEMIRKLQSKIWHYAKRQIAWFKRETRIKWFRPTEVRRIEKEVQNFLEP